VPPFVFEGSTNAELAAALRHSRHVPTWLVPTWNAPQAKTGFAVWMQRIEFPLCAAVRLVVSSLGGVD
jgi:hypothetical protein